MEKLYILFTILVCFSISVYGQQLGNEELLNLANTVNEKEIIEYATKLTSSEFDGRLSGSPGYMKSAEWIASKFEEWGIKPLGDNGYYLQYFDNAYTKVFDSGSVSYQFNDITSKTTEKTYRFPEEYFPGQNSGSGTIEGDLVYVGFGISAPELGYDDYAGIDVKGKILVFESGLPVKGNIPDIERWVQYDYHQYKFKNAIAHGAIGWLYISKLANPNTSYNKDIVYAHIGDEVANDIFNASGKNYKEIREKIAADLKPNSFELKGMAKIAANTQRFEDSKSCNVIGLIEGIDPILKNEVIIIGAHLDAVGNLGKLLPGALDNASGVVDIMTAARILVQSPVKPKRSLLFIMFGGEECGLLGSTFYVNNPKFQKEDVVCMINLDMVGNGTGLALWGGESFPEISKHFTDANTNYIKRSMRTSEARPVKTRPRTDGAVFTMNGYKSFAIGTTDGVKPVYYHHPLDNVDGLTPDIMVEVSRMIYFGLLGVANDENLKL
ncbi:MAG: M28 family peptidase [Bacteroidales bacterium]